MIPRSQRLHSEMDGILRSIAEGRRIVPARIIGEQLGKLDYDDLDFGFFMGGDNIFRPEAECWLEVWRLLVQAAN